MKFSKTAIKEFLDKMNSITEYGIFSLYGEDEHAIQFQLKMKNDDPIISGTTIPNVTDGYVEIVNAGCKKYFNSIPNFNNTGLIFFIMKEK